MVGVRRIRSASRVVTRRPGRTMPERVERRRRRAEDVGGEQLLSVPVLEGLGPWRSGQGHRCRRLFSPGQPGPGALPQQRAPGSSARQGPAHARLRRLVRALATVHPRRSSLTVEPRPLPHVPQASPTRGHQRIHLSSTHGRVWQSHPPRLAMPSFCSTRLPSGNCATPIGSRPMPCGLQAAASSSSSVEKTVRASSNADALLG